MNLGAFLILSWLAVSQSAWAVAGRGKSTSLFRLSAESYSRLGFSRKELERDLFATPPFPLRATIGKLAWEGEEWDLPGTTRTTVQFEPQLMLPSQTEDWDNDWIASGRLFSRLRYDPSPDWKFTLRDSAVYHVYRTGGYIGEYGPRASRVFENRLKLAAEVALVRDKLTLTFPVTYKQVKHANYQEGARFNDRWRHSLWIHPEIAYYFSGENYVSLMYESDTFISSRFDEFYFLESLAAGGISAWVSIEL